MKIVNVMLDSKIYTSNAFLLLGDWNGIDDVNTLVDVGRDDFILDVIKGISTGVGKKAVDQVILTHNHFDHTGNLSILKKRFNPKVYAFSPGQYVDEQLKDGDVLKVADRTLEVIHAPGHSHDSILLYCREERILFTGDTPVIVRTPGGSYSSEFVEVMERVSQLHVETIYFGHGPARMEGCNKLIAASLDNMKKSRNYV